MASYLILAIDFVLLCQYLHLTLISFVRIRNGKNGLTPYLLLVSMSLSMLMALDMATHVAVVAGHISGDSHVIEPLFLIEVMVRTVLVVANAVYFIAIRKEALTPFKRMSATRELLFKAVERSSNEQRQ